MEIKYDASGQPLPFEQQPAAQQQQAAPEVKPIEPQERQSDDSFQLSNPFVAQYLRESSKPEVESTTLNVDSSNSEPESEPEAELPPTPAPRSGDHPNFKSLRLAAEKAERERDEYFRLLQERDRRDVLQSKSRAPQNEEESDDLGLEDDGFPEAKHLKKIHKQSKKLEREFAEYRQNTQKELQEASLYRRYPNIDEVVSPENIATLTELKPAYARQLAELHQRGDIYGTGELAYNYMVDLGIYKSNTKSAAPVSKDYTADKMRAHANAAKPRPVVSGTAAKGESPLARAHAFAGDLNDADMKRHFQEMQQAISNRGD